MEPQFSFYYTRSGASFLSSCVQVEGVSILDIVAERFPGSRGEAQTNTSQISFPRSFESVLVQLER